MTLSWHRAHSYWVMESRCGRYRIERFVAGQHPDSNLHFFPRPIWYRLLKRCPQGFWREIAPAASDQKIAKQICSEDAQEGECQSCAA